MKRILVQCVPSLLLVLLFNYGMLSAEPVPVRHREGTAHGFLLVRTPEGTAIATGDLVQVPHGDQITSRLTFHFKDGSIDDETTVYSQRVVFRLISDLPWETNLPTPTFGSSAGKLRPFSNGKAQPTRAVPFGPLS